MICLRDFYGGVSANTANGATKVWCACDACKRKRHDEAWWVARLDEWQHRRPFGRWWTVVWRPLCDYRDWRYGVPLRQLIGRRGVAK